MLAFVRKWFWVGCGAVGIGVIVLALLGSGWLGFRLFQLEWTPQGQTDLRMRAAPIAFENQTDISEHTGSLPFMAGVIIDIDGDFRDEVFLGGGRGQADCDRCCGEDRHATHGRQGSGSTEAQSPPGP